MSLHKAALPSDCSTFPSTTSKSSHFPVPSRGQPSPTIRRHSTTGLRRFQLKTKPTRQCLLTSNRATSQLLVSSSSFVLLFLSLSQQLAPFEKSLLPTGPSKCAPWNALNARTRPPAQQGKQPAILCSALISKTNLNESQHAHRLRMMWP